MNTILFTIWQYLLFVQIFADRLNIKQNLYVVLAFLEAFSRGFLANLTRLALLAFSVTPITLYSQVQASSDISITVQEDVVKEASYPTRTIKRYTLKEKYQEAAGIYYYPEVEKHLKTIDKVLIEQDLERDENFIKIMFFIGQHESHWNRYSVSSSFVGSEHPTGVFQFLPSTFRTVSDGDIYDVEDQIRAFVTMYKRNRLDEFGTLYITTLEPYLRYYGLN